MQLAAKIHRSSIVVRGLFNPAIFQPQWLAFHELISDTEAEGAEIKIIHPKVSSFNANWLDLTVTSDRLAMTTSQEAYFELLRDCAIGIFTILSETPIRALGINQTFHFALPSEDIWNDIGYTLVPKENWTDILERPGLRNLVAEGLRPDDYDGYIRVQVQPSNEVTHGVFIETNDHFQIATTDEIQPGTEELLKILSDEWDNSDSRGKKAAIEVASLAQ